MSFELPNPGVAPGFKDLATLAAQQQDQIRVTIDEATDRYKGDIAGHVKLPETLDKFCTDLSMLLTWNKGRADFRFVKRATKTAAFVAQKILEPNYPTLSTKQLLERRDSTNDMTDFVTYVVEGPLRYLNDRFAQLELIDRSNAHLRGAPKELHHARYIGGLVHMQIDEALYAQYAHTATTEFADALSAWDGTVSEF